MNEIFNPFSALIEFNRPPAIASVVLFKVPQSGYIVLISNNSLFDLKIVLGDCNDSIFGPSVRISLRQCMCVCASAYTVTV